MACPGAPGSPREAHWRYTGASSKCYDRRAALGDHTWTLLGQEKGKQRDDMVTHQLKPSWTWLWMAAGFALLKPGPVHPESSGDTSSCSWGLRVFICLVNIYWEPTWGQNSAYNQEPSGPKIKPILKNLQVWQGRQIPKWYNLDD